MQSALHHSYTYHKAKRTSSLWKRFITWAYEQEENRLGWMAFSMVGHGCVFTILTILIVLFTGNHFIFWPFTIAAMMTVMVVNIAGMPTKIIIPALFGSLLIDFVIIFISLLNGFHMAAVYR